MPTRLLVLGVDAACPDLLRRWAGEGRLPAIRRLLERGTSGAVQGLTGLFIGSTWPSLYTGLNPASHGFYRIEQLRSGSYGFFRPLDSPNGVGGRPFWKLASDVGRRVAVLDVPLTRLEPGLAGVQTVEWGGHDSVFGFQASSPRVARRVRAVAGRYPLPSNCDGDRRGAAALEDFVARLESAVEKKKRLTLDFLERERWDLFVQVFTESHCAGHQCWHVHEPAHPAHDPALLEAVGDPIERVYTALDRAIGEIVERAGASAVLLVAAHGMGPYRGAQLLLPEILFRLGAAERAPVPADRSPGPRERTVRAARGAWRRIVPRGARAAVAPIRARLRPARAGTGSVADHGIDPRRSRCFAVPNGAPVGGIRLNLRGREPEGALAPGAEAEAFCAELTEDLLALVDPRTGRPLVRAVYPTESLYKGSRRDALPDLLVEWAGDTALGSAALAGGRGARVCAASPKIGLLEAENRYTRSGEHLPEGLFVGTGSGVPEGLVRAPVSIMDIHPTICRLLGLEPPAVDGRSIAEFVELAAHD